MRAFGFRIATLAMFLAVSFSQVGWSDIISFTNTTPIILPLGPGNAAPYGSPILVSGVVGPIENITISLTGVSHSYPDDMAAVVVSPTGASVLLMSGPGPGFLEPAGPRDISNLNWVFDDNAAAPLPQTTALASGTFRPGQNEYDDYFPAPGPGGQLVDGDPIPWTFNLAPLLSLPPNGTWNLYMRDGQFPDDGTVSGGWGVHFQVAAVPEPSSMAVLGLLVGAVVTRRRQRA